MVEQFDSVFWTAVAVGVPTVIVSAITPIVMSILASRQRAAEKKADNQRADEIADRLAVANVMASVAAKEAVVAAKTTNEKLDIIHILVNSTLTAAIQAAYDAKVAAGVVLRRLIGAEQAAGRVVNVDDAVLLRVLDAEIAELRVKLAGRARAASSVAQQQVVNEVRAQYDHQSIGGQTEVRGPDQAKGG